MANTSFSSSSMIEGARKIPLRSNALSWVRWVPLALVPLLLLASDFPGEYRVPIWYWSAALAAAVVCLMGARWPLLVSLVLRIGVAQHVLAGADPRIRSVLDDVHDTASGALDDIRRLLVALRDPSPGEVALVEADAVSTEIAAAVERTRATGFAVDAEVDTNLGDLDTVAAGVLAEGRRRRRSAGRGARNSIRPAA